MRPGELAVKSTITSAAALKTALVDSVTQYDDARRAINLRTMRGLFHGDDGELRAKRLKELAELNKDDLAKLFALFYAVMSPYMPFRGPVDLSDMIHRSSWLANCLGEAMIKGELKISRYAHIPEHNSHIDTLKSPVLKKELLSLSKQAPDAFLTYNSQLEAHSTYDKPAALRWTLLHLYEAMDGNDRAAFDKQVHFFMAALRETDADRVKAAASEDRAKAAALEHRAKTAALEARAALAAAALAEKYDAQHHQATPMRTM